MRPPPFLAMAGISRLPCVRGGGFSACLQQAEKTEGLYRRLVIAFSPSFSAPLTQGSREMLYNPAVRPCTGEARVALKTLGAKLAQGRQEKFAIAAAKGQKNWLAPFGASMLYICLTGLFLFFAYSVSFAGKYFCRRARVAAEKSSLPSPPSSRSQVTWLAMALFPEQSAFIVLRSSAR